MSAPRLQNQAASSAESFTSIWQRQARSKEARKHESGARPAPRSLCCWNQAGKKTLARPPGRRHGARPRQKPAAAKPDDARTTGKQGVSATDNANKNKRAYLQLLVQATRNLVEAEGSICEDLVAGGNPQARYDAGKGKKAGGGKVSERTILTQGG